VLTLVAAVYARPDPGFAYSVVDPGQGNAAVITSNVVPAQQQVVYTAAAVPAATANVITTYAHQPVVYTTNLHAGYVSYFSGACHNNDGQVVPCAGEESFVAPQPVLGGQKIETPVAAAPIDSSPPSQTGIIDVEKREAEADPLYYYNTINPAAYAYAHQPIVYSHAPVVAAAPAPAIVYTAAHIGCMNNEGKHVACIGEPEPVDSRAMPISAMPEAMAPVEAKSSEPIQGEQTALEAAAAAAKDSGIVSVKKRGAEADPLYYTALPYTSPLAVTPNVYAQNPLMYTNPALYKQMVYAQQPIVYQTIAGCRNNEGSIVPCAMGQNYIQALPLLASPAPVMPQMTQGVAPVEEQKSQEPVSAPDSTGTVIDVKKREADGASEAISEPLYYADTYRFPGYTYRAFGDHAVPVAAPQTYTVSAPIVKDITTVPVASTAYVAAPVATVPVAATSYVAPSPIIAAVQPGCRNENGSVVPCA